MRNKGAQPEDQVYWNQYRFLPRPQMFLMLDERWLDIAGWDAFEDDSGYDISAPEALPSGCQAGGEAWYSVANVPREWEAHQRIQDTIQEFLATRSHANTSTE